MSGATRARAILLTLASLVLVAEHAQAQPDDEGVSPPFQLAYDAPPETCPNALSFFGAIRARTERARLAHPGETAVAVAVRITKLRGGSVVGRVEIREPDDVRQERTVESATCKEVALALALVVALYLDPDATMGPEPPPPPPPPPEPAARRPSARPKVVAPPAPTPAATPPIGLGAGAGVGVAGGVGPSVAPLARAFAEVVIDGAAIARATSWARPSARLSVDVATTSGDVAAGWQAYQLVAGSLRLCPVDVTFGRRIHAGPCGALQAGVHRGTSEGIPNARDQDKPWVSPLATLHAGLVLAERLSLEIEGGVAVPLVRTRYFLRPDVTLFRTPAVAGIMSAAVTFHFR